MQVLRLVEEHKYNIGYNLASVIGTGADGEVISLYGAPNKVIKLSVLYDYPHLYDLHSHYQNIIQVMDYLLRKQPHTYAHLYEYKHLGEHSRETIKGIQKYILYFYVLEKLNKLSDDEKRVFSSVISHNDSGNKKNYDLLKIKSMLLGMNKSLDFNIYNVFNFCKLLKYDKIDHNDLHERNIMKDNSGQFKLIDFDRAIFKTGD